MSGPTGGQRRGTYMVERCYIPARAHGWGLSPHYDEDHFGGDSQWCFGVPWVFRALASPQSMERLPASPFDSDVPRSVDRLSQACGYWNCLLYLLTYSFGWSRPDRGFKWWMDHGQPVEDPRFQLISEIWGRDGHLDWFAAFLYSQDYRHSSLAPMALGFTAEPVAVDSRWIDEQKRQQQDEARGGPEGKHLTVGPGKRDHSSGPIMEPRVRGQLLRSKSASRRAVFTTTSAWGWYGSLDEAGRKALKKHPGLDWKVDVVVLPMGWLGTFRRSWTTGLWFSGKHRYHIVGN